MDMDFGAITFAFLIINILLDLFTLSICIEILERGKKKND